MLKNISARKFQIISTGGGILTNDTNFSIIRASGKIICLEATPDTIKKRLNIWQLKNFEESYTYKIKNGISLLKKSKK